jgi:hypothetical protein
VADRRGLIQFGEDEIVPEEGGGEFRFLHVKIREPDPGFSGNA